MDKLDRYDLRILQELQNNAQLSNQDLAAEDARIIAAQLKTNTTWFNSNEIGTHTRPTS